MIDPSQMINPKFIGIYKKIMDNTFPYTHLWLTGGRGCIDEDTLIDTPKGKVKVKDFQGGQVLSYDGEDVITAYACKPIKYPAEDLYTVKTETKEITVTAKHRFLTQRGWLTAEDCIVGDVFITLSNNAINTKDYTDLCLNAIDETSTELSDKFKITEDNKNHKKEKIVSIKFCKHAPFYDLFVPIFNCYFGNGILNHNSGKSSFAGFIIPLLIMRDSSWFMQGFIPPELLSNAVVLRKFGNTLRESVYQQISSAINMLGVNELWDGSLNPLQFTYKPTKQRIIFRGLDDATKTKSIKVERGRISIVWYEELEEFNGMAEIRKANQSFLRGGGIVGDNQVQVNPLALYSYNPPRTMASWVNEEALKKIPSRMVVKSSYLDMPPEWLGSEFLKEALELRDVDIMSYRHEYLGEIVGVEGTIFKNVKGRKVTDREIKSFRNCLQGLDWGFGHPAAFTQSFYDYARGDLYIFGEVVQQGLTNPELADKIRKQTRGDRRTLIIADCEDKKSIQEFKRMGFNIMGCRKHRGTKGEIYGVKWLQKLNNIYIDEERCPETFKAFCGYAYKRDKDGFYTDNLPDKGEDPIDSVRYALQSYIYPPTFSTRK